MIIDGKTIADSMLSRAKDSVDALKEKGITPKLAVVLVGDDPASLSYIRQKQKAAERIGATLTLEQYPQTMRARELHDVITRLNSDASVHGLIVQRPVPTGVGIVSDILETISPVKDIDGFIRNSPFEVPVARAVLSMLSSVFDQLKTKSLASGEFIQWLTRHKTVVIGRGDTAGAPITALLSKYGCVVSVVHSKTRNKEQKLKEATIIISCVGKQRILRKQEISRGVILISVGLTRGEDGKLHGDYETSDVEGIASFYTPTPGGVGPVNVACLMQNLVDACIIQTNGGSL